MKGCVFAGSFDPITVGHERVIRECAKEYDKVLVVIGENKDKSYMFDETTRARFVEKTFSDLDNVEVIRYSENRSRYGDLLKEKGCLDYIRGIRNDTDLAFEEQMKAVNEKIYSGIRTVYKYVQGQDALFSSSLVRETIVSGGDYSALVPKAVLEDVKNALSHK